MAHLHPHVLGGRVPLGGFVPSPALLEQKIATQHAEIQALITENSRLATTHVALRQELAATQQELKRAQQALALLQTEKEQQVRTLAEQIAKLEADMRAAEPLKAELENAKAGAHKLLAVRQDLNNQVSQLTKDLIAARTEAQKTLALKAEMETLRHETTLARTALEYEKKAHTELLEQRGAMETNLVSMAREVEKLRVELANTERSTRVGSYASAYGAADSAYPSTGLYGDGYNLSQISLAAEKSIPYGSASAATWGAYDLQRGIGGHLRR